MSSGTTSYSSMLENMWAPDGSDINERLQRLHNLELMRKEREAKRAAMMKDGGYNSASIVRTSRLRSTATDSSTAAPSVRRTLSLNEDSDYGGARPKHGSFRLNTELNLGTCDVNDPFGDVKAQVLASLKTSQKEYTSSRIGSSDSENSNPGYSSTRSNYDFSRSYNNPVDMTSFSSNTDNLLSKYSKRNEYTSRFANEHVGEQNGTADYSTEPVIDNSEGNHDDETEHNYDHVEDDEEPRHFIERLKQGNHDIKDPARSVHGSQNSAFILNSIPTVPPYRHSEYTKPADLPELVQPTDDILSVAQEINATFGVTNPELSQSKTPNKKGKRPKSSTSSTKKKSTKKMAPEVPAKPVNTTSAAYDTGEFSTDANSEVTYEIHEVNYDSSGDEAGKILPVRESFYNSRPSEWGVLATTPGKIDKMHEFFHGDDIGDDPNISRELDGEKVKAELEKNDFDYNSNKSNQPKIQAKSDQPKTPVKVDRPKTPVKVDQSKTSVKVGRPVSTTKKTSEKEKVNGRRSKSPLDRLKNSVMRSSESENDSVNTSGSESEVKTNGYKNRKTPKGNTKTKKDEKKELSLGDKLAKLESMTQEKKRKHSVGEKDEKKPVPSYMSGTNASNQKRARSKDVSTVSTPSGDLKKDLRELKQFVRENSVPSTPVDSPVKSFTEFYGTSKQLQISTREISVQTEFVIDFPDINYVCKHCGKSSFEEVVSSPLTVENLNKSQKKMNGKKDAKPTDGKFSSKDSVKSLGDNSTKSERTTRYTKKTTNGSSHSYMKGTTSSRLKNSGPPSESDRVRKGSAPELVHDSKGSSLRGTVSQRAKVFENASKGRAKSSERKTDIDEKKKLRKSKSVDHVSAVMNGLTLPPDDVDDLETTLTGSETIQSQSSPESTTEPKVTKNKPSSQLETTPRSATDAKVASPQPLKPHAEVGKLDLSSLETPLSPNLRKPPLASPRVKDDNISPRSETNDTAETAVESKGQFTSIGDNPFIKKDGSNRTRTRSRDKIGESVWEKAEGRSRESSLKRSNSSSTAERSNSASSLKRHNTSAGEKSSVSELTWSDSGSTESLNKGSKSSHHGSNQSLNRDCDRAVFHRPRSVSSSSSTTSQNAMLNLLTPPGSTRHPVSGAIETDVDAAYNDHVKELKSDIVDDKHNEESVNKAHLEFAKSACTALEFELKKRDSSNESNKSDKNSKHVVEDKENTADVETASMTSSQTSLNTIGEPKQSKKEKLKKGLMKVFKK